jgi:hypothetical protein
VRMVIEGASASVGAPPLWLRQAADVRVTRLSGRETATVFHLEAPPLGEAAKEIYRQDSLWETRPPESETAINVLARVLDDVTRADAESGRYDRQLLSRIMRMRRLFHNRIVSMRFPSRVADEPPSTLITSEVVENATRLADRTPPPRQIRLTGMLDMIRHSTRSFGLKLDDGTEVRGVLETHEQTEQLKQFLGNKLLVLGKAVTGPQASSSGWMRKGSRPARANRCCLQNFPRRVSLGLPLFGQSSRWIGARGCLPSSARGPARKQMKTLRECCRSCADDRASIFA